MKIFWANKLLKNSWLQSVFPEKLWSWIGQSLNYQKEVSKGLTRNVHIQIHYVYYLTHFMSLISFYTPWKHQKTFGFLMFSWGVERDQRHEICSFRSNVCLYFNFLQQMLQNSLKKLPEVFCKTGVFKNFAKYNGKRLCYCLFFNKAASGL